MRTQLIAVLCLGCGSSSTNSPDRPPDRPQEPATPDPRTSRDAMVREIFARLVAGDGSSINAFADEFDERARRA